MKRGLLAAVAAALAVTFIALDPERYLTFENLKSQQATLGAYYQAYPARTITLFFAFCVAATTLSIPGGALLALAAGAIFGLPVGAVLVSFASSLGALAAFLLARYLLRDGVERRFGARLRPVNAGVERDGVFYLFALRLVPAIPFFAVNVAMALTSIRAWTYYWVSQLGMLAGTVIYINAGAQLAKIRSVGDVFSPGLIASFILLALLPFFARAALDSARTRKRLARYPKIPDR